MYCAKCGTHSSEGDIFCRKCGAPLNRTTNAPAPTPTAQTKIEVKETMTISCSECGAQNAEGRLFCNKCGNNLAVQPLAPQSSNDAINAQLKEARHHGTTGWFELLLGSAIMGIRAWIGFGSTSTRYIGNGGYEIYHPHATLATIVVVLGVIIGIDGCVGGILSIITRARLIRKVK